MLPPRHRMRRSDDFTLAVRSGTRGSGTHVVVHLLVPVTDAEPTPAEPARVGFVVSKAIGNAVQRNRVKRRLRHLVTPRLHRLPDGALLVVRALAPSAGASSADLGQALDRAWTSAVRRADRGGARR